MTNELILAVFYFLILLYSIILHEVAHGVVALWLGDLTAKYSGRITLLPWSHIDLVGSIILPLALFFTAGFAFGYAKPVPYNPYNLRDQKWGPLKVALAGPGTNFLIALSAALLAALLPMAYSTKQTILMSLYGVVGGHGDFLDRFSAMAAAVTGSFGSIFFGLFLLIIFWNVILGCFNLIPIPPLDGSKILFALFPISEETQRQLEQYGFFILLFIILFIPGPIGTFIDAVLRLFLGIVLW